MVNAMSNYVASASSYTYLRYTEPILQLSAVTRVSCDVVSDYRCVCRALSMSYGCDLMLTTLDT